jgi:insulysin
LLTHYALAETVYHFDCTPAGLPGALARHAQFFTSPLFEASCTDRELNAVDSEFRRNLSLDARRLFQLGKSLSSPNSVYRKFGTGSKETLQKADVRERLLEWYAENYSANLMNLVVISSRTSRNYTSLLPFVQLTRTPKRHA